MSKRKWESTGFGARLKAIREGAGKSQQQLAEAVGVDVMTISRLERGGQEPAWPLALVIASALGVTCQAFQQVPAGAAEPPPGPPTPGERGGPGAAGAQAGGMDGPRAVGEVVRAVMSGAKKPKKKGGGK